MLEKTKYTIGDFEFESWSESTLEAVAYVGATGAGSVATIPESVVLEGQILSHIGCEYELRNKQIETVISKANLSELEDMPALRKVTIHMQNTKPLKLKNIPGPVIVEYLKGIANYEPLWKDEEIAPIAGNGVHAVFGDEIEQVGTLRGGHITLGKGIKGIRALKKPEFGITADCTVAEYELPMRLDFLSPTPPTVGSVAPGALTITEIHVPNGALEAYTAHPQWGKAAYIVEEGGKTIDNYVIKHKARLKKLEAEAKDAHEKAKAEKVKAMSEVASAMLAPQKLAAWNPEIKENETDYEVKVQVGSLSYQLCVPKDAPLEIWDTLAAQLNVAQTLMAK